MKLSTALKRLEDREKYAFSTMQDIIDYVHIEEDLYDEDDYYGDSTENYFTKEQIEKAKNYLIDRPTKHLNIKSVDFYNGVVEIKFQNLASDDIWLIVRFLRDSVETIVMTKNYVLSRSFESYSDIDAVEQFYVNREKQK